MSVDPIARKYPSLSPYVYAANNPHKFIDPDGKKLYFANGVSSQFKSQFASAVKYLNKHGASGSLAKLHASKNVYYITGGDRNLYDPKTNTVTWNAIGGLLTTSGNTLSPSVALVHETSHAVSIEKNPAQVSKDHATNDPEYGDVAEKKIILGPETNTARKTGEIGPNDISRPDHIGQQYPTTGPTSTETDWDKAGKVPWDDVNVSPIEVIQDEKEEH